MLKLIGFNTEQFKFINSNFEKTNLMFVIRMYDGKTKSSFNK